MKLASPPEKEQTCRISFYSWLTLFILTVAVLEYRALSFYFVVTLQGKTLRSGFISVLCVSKAFIAVLTL